MAEFIGQSSHFAAACPSHSLRGALGICLGHWPQVGIELRKDDYVVSVCAVSAEDKERMLSVSELGYGKQTPITTYRLQSRGGKGVINMKTTDKTGKVVAVFPVEDESEIMIITQQGKLIRIEASDIRKTGRSAQGVRLIKTDAGDKVTSASLVEAAEEETEESPTN